MRQKCIILASANTSPKELFKGLTKNPRNIEVRLVQNVFHHEQTTTICTIANSAKYTMYDCDDPEFTRFKSEPKPHLLDNQVPKELLGQIKRIIETVDIMLLVYMRMEGMKEHDCWDQIRPFHLTPISLGPLEPELP